MSAPDVAVEIKRHPSGLRYCRPYLGTDEVTGRPRRPYKSFPAAGSDEEALEMARAWLAQVLDALEVGSDARLGELLDRYLVTLETAQAPQNTLRAYRVHAQRAGHLRRKAARDVTAMDVDALYAHLLSTGTSPRTVATFHWFLSGAMQWMVDVGAIPTNPVRSATPPRWEGDEPPVWEEDEIPDVLAVIDGARRSRYRLRRVVGMAATVSLFGGLRVGEALGLRWCDVRRGARTVHVRGTVSLDALHRPFRQGYTKGKRPRAVAMDAAFWERLDEWRSAQRDLGLGTSRAAPVITTSGGWVRPGSVSEAFRALMAGAGLEGEYHKLRHTHATVLLAGGEDPRVVQERLGHATLATTLTLYSHVLPARDLAAASRFSQVATAGAAGRFREGR